MKLLAWGDWVLDDIRLEDEWLVRVKSKVAALGANRGKQSVANSTGRGDSVTNAPHEAEELSRNRADAVAQVIEELKTIRRDVRDEDSYKRQVDLHPEFLVFEIVDNDPKLRKSVVRIAGKRGLVELAQELVASHFEVAIDTVVQDWKRHKPEKFRKRSK